MADSVIVVENLSKSYLVGHRSDASGRYKYTALRDVVGREARNFARKAADLVRGRQIVQGDEVEEFWALKDVSFEVKQGEVLGIIGRNGAGKSTLLKILSRITEPTSGRVTLHGRVASLLEVGTGFHPELTGRENIFLNGAILGMARREIQRRFDEIVAFAEVEKFLDTPVKHYSSGMYVRLAFAVAAHLQSEILIVDEVLAVGDLDFQRKCLGRMDQIARHHGRTILFVSHNMAAIRALCTVGVLIEKGEILSIGAIGDCLQSYMDRSNDRTSPLYRRIAGGKRQEWYTEEAWLQQGGSPTRKIRQSVPLNFIAKIRGHAKQRIAVELVIRDRHKYPILFIPSGLGFGCVMNLEAGTYSIEATINLPRMAMGTYFVDVIVAESGRRHLDVVEAALEFEIDEPAEPAWSFHQSGGQGVITVPRDGFRLECREFSEAHP